MTTINISDFEEGEKSTNKGYHLVRNIMALGSSNHECTAVVASKIGILERKVAHVVQSTSQDLYWDAEFEGSRILVSYKVGENELPYCELLEGILFSGCS